MLPDTVIQALTNVAAFLYQTPGHVVLVNADVTPENFLLDAQGTLSIVDPVPRLDISHHYFAWVTYCYRYLFVLVSDAPRYRPFLYEQHKSLLCQLAEGFETVCIEQGTVTSLQLKSSEFLWALDTVIELFELTQRPLSEKETIRYGDSQQIQLKFVQSVQDLLETTQRLTS